MNMNVRLKVHIGNDKWFVSYAPFRLGPGRVPENRFDHNNFYDYGRVYVASDFFLFL